MLVPATSDSAMDERRIRMSKKRFIWVGGIKKLFYELEWLGGGWCVGCYECAVDEDVEDAAVESFAE